MSYSHLSYPDTTQFPFHPPEYDPIAIRELNDAGVLHFGPNDMYSKPWFNHEEQRQEYYNKFPNAYYQHKDPAKRGFVTPYQRKSAVSKVPAELWMTIAQSGDPTPVGAIMPLSQVSGGLREVVGNMSEQYTTLLFQPLGPKRKLPSRQQVRERVQKSGNRPLTIAFAVDCVDSEMPSGLLDIMKELMCCLSRWQDVTLYVPWTHGMVELLNRGDGPPTMLRSLRLEGHTTYQSLDPFVSSLVRYAQSISRFHWVDTFGQESYNSSGFATALPMNFGNLSQLHLDNPLVLPDAFLILSQTQRLVSLEINNLSIVETDPRTAPTTWISLPMLVSMKLVVHFEMFEARSNVSLVGPLISYLIAPALRHAHFGFDENWDQSAFASLLRKSNCQQLQSLVFDTVSITEENLKETVQFSMLQGSLQSLTIKTAEQPWSPLSQKVLERMTPSAKSSRSSASCYVPGLRKLCVNLFTIQRLNGQFAEMVKSRAASGLLKEVEIVGTEDVGSRFLKRMPQDVEAVNTLGPTMGLKVTISAK
ncbi:hypothetical protein MD484_g4677, partial [Candolleomyces efflorescens]